MHLETNLRNRSFVFCFDLVEGLAQVLRVPFFVDQGSDRLWSVANGRAVVTGTGKLLIQEGLHTSSPCILIGQIFL